MEKEFVPYELALKLKELGFDEECLAGYIYLKGSNSWELAFYKDRIINFNKTSNLYVSAPLWQQAFDWFRENCELMNHLTTHLNTWGKDGELEESYGYRIMFNKDGWKCEVWDELSYFDTYEEARLECLKKLIEIMSK